MNMNMNGQFCATMPGCCHPAAAAATAAATMQQ